MRIFFDARVLTPQAHHGIARHGLGLLRELFVEPGRHSYLVLAGSRQAAEWLGGFPKEEGRFRLEVLELRPYRIQEQYLLPRLLARHGPDLYYSPTFMPPALTRTPVAFTIHDLTQIEQPRDHPLKRRLIWKHLIRPKARRSRAVLTVSGWAAGQIARWLGTESSRIQVIGNGLEEAYRPRSPEEIRAAEKKVGIRSPYFTMIGNPMPHKNLRAGARAFQEFCRKGFQGCLVMIGAGRLELPEGPGRVVRLEGVDDDLLAALHSGALASLFPSLAEGFGLPPLEAMACGTPVVASDLPVFREVLGPETAYLVPAQGHGLGPLVERLEYLAARPVEVRERAEANQALARQHTWARAGSRLRKVFDEIESGRGS